ncbi:MFS transporter [Kitasatospora kazusensis]|uniref:MFS transporter n=1 Tax=Kitasatospora kazusensis TaxID=407974 RepID=A0ABP5LBC6_9ACTN
MATWGWAKPAAGERPRLGLGLGGLRDPLTAATALAAVLNVLWALFLARDSGDLAAQYAWTDFIRQNPDSAYNLSWYGGMHTASYSLLSPYLMGWLGVRTTGVLAATASTTVAAWLLLRVRAARPLPLALWTAVALSADLYSGRVTFALGVLFALGAVALLFPAAGRERARLVAVLGLGALASTASPVAGLFLEVVAAALFLDRRRSESYALAAGPVLVIGGTALLFPFQGVQPFDWWLAWPLAVSAACAAVLLPREWRVLRAGSAVYALGAALTWLIPSPVGSNVERLPLLFGPTVLLAAVLRRPDGGRPVDRRRRAALALLLCAGVLWQVTKPIGDLVTTVPAQATALHPQPLIDELRRVGADRGRVEVVPLRTHGEASDIAPYVNLARGWNRQADVARNPLFYQDALAPDDYHAWLQYWGVGFVVLPAGQPDDAAVDEARIVQEPHSWLSPVWKDANWQLYRVTDALPLVAPPATVQLAGPAAVTIEVPQAGSVLLRIPWSPWLSLGAEAGGTGSCLTEGGGDWTVLHAAHAGTYQVASRYGLPRGAPCEKA